MKISRSFLICAATMAALGAACVQAQQSAETIIFNAHVVTVDGKFSMAQAASIANGKFLKVGSNQDVLGTAGPNTVKVDLRGQTVVPGFNDTHNHQLLMGRTLSVNIDLQNIRSIADIQKAVAERVKVVKPGDWIVGTRGWWENQLSDKRTPNRFDFDKVAPNNPVLIPGPHYVIANSLALKLGKITKDTPNPQGGEIYKDRKTGEPTGQLFDNAGRAVYSLVPKQSREDSVKGLLQAMAANNSNGITSVSEPSASKEDMEIYQSILKEGKLTTRVDFAYDIDPADPIDEVKQALAALGAPTQGPGDGMLRADQLGETGLDGADKTALLRQEFPGRPGYKGMFKVTQQHFNEFALAVAEAGWRLRPHAVGDGAIDEALTSYEYVNGKIDISKRRWMIDHAFLVLPDMYPRIRNLGVIINSQYTHTAQLGELILAAWRRPLADKMENYKDWLAGGLTFTGGSDGPIIYITKPLYIIGGMVTRDTEWGGKLGADQGITREQAIRALTSWSALTSFEENIKGSIEPGKYADFVVLSDDILKVPAQSIKDLKVRATVLGGRTVFGKLQ